CVVTVETVTPSIAAENIILRNVGVVIIEYLANDGEKDKHTSYLKTLKNSRPLHDFKEYAIDTPYMMLWSKIKKTYFQNTTYPKPNTLYWSILRIQEIGSVYGHRPYPKNQINGVKMDDPNITIEEYIRLEEEKARRHGKVYNWETATYGKIWYNKDVHVLGSVETEFPAIVFNDTLTFEAALSCEHMEVLLTTMKLTLEYRLTNPTMKIAR
ncbi:hypothetical protein Tco_0633593, partial [Tanacetum coccineum]